MSRRLIQRIALLLFIVSLLFACSARKALPPGEIPAAQVITETQRIKARSLINSFISDLDVVIVEEKSILDRVMPIHQRLMQAAGYDPRMIPLVVVESDGLANALALEGCAIIIFDGLLEKISNDSELAAVMGHEVGHILARHYEEDDEDERADNLSTGSAIFGAVTQMALGIAGLGALGPAAGSAARSTVELVGFGAYVRAFDREQEYEADQIGMLVMAKAGYNPNAAITLWRDTHKIFGDEVDMEGSFYSTHPGANDRVEGLQENLPIAMQIYQNR